MKTFLGLVTLAALLAGCGQQAQLQNLQSADPRTYIVDIGPPDADCATGHHAYRGVVAYCQGLQDETANNHCAQAVRRALFTAQPCDGTFQPF